MSGELDRFVDAQRDTYAAAFAELKRGRKTSHWMWFVFPQIAGLGHSQTAKFYALQSLDEARAYLAHPVLGPRLHECIAALAALPPITADAVFGGIDAIKLRSSLTLFIAAGGGDDVVAALDHWYGGRSDDATLGLLGS
ncbi:DUF1810 domain-containing protein [Polymorphobacter sp. PAMC 29334]|uniref:DUF1810 domain-containing protein n=1 Tax=Polymorphobacter sp. PAMC 29334 TaxID=2862331 RepID=UPI001C67133A|nr:DUF1810 domain-containing protein [Polymorphobacter sp. PAMC 29334]QYE34678.1 DUF1810 domain-containing protein [Polymorphobacter sp. PAMC 29334]